MRDLAQAGVFTAVLFICLIATYAIGWISKGDNYDDAFATAWGTAVMALAFVITVLLDKMGWM